MIFRNALKIIFLGLFTVSLSCTKVIHEKDLFYPRHLPILSDEVVRTNTSIMVEDTISLRGWFIHSPSYKRSLIYFYGNGENVYDSSVPLYWLATNLKCNILAMDYRGYGVSDGKPSFNSLLADGIKIYDFLVDSLGQSPAATFVYGRSIGTLPAVHVASQKPVSGLILQAPPTSAAEIIPRWKSLAPWYIRWILRVRPDKDLKNYHPQPVEDIRKVAAPLLIIHGTEDDIIPIDFGRRMFEEAGSKQKRWCPVKGYGHNNLRIYDSPISDSLRAFVNPHGD
ncbi:MAG: alpha/beta fold hydrolase [Candidatus Zixiibacteriota bacterium]